ncbi:DNA-binding transcriptional regulator, FadR family [Maridesulfovibrio ferrireducens]|uniref:DNA-binding transcriptional regulator, FadR family n=1 Tax=Maridesulfovibrio ferrireducens TaxID=246191 RepID=A0A1G9BAB0_9BACT|nr:GntR family transcriptional regulator [Maridesulfovibrio ferrireducens]SDK36369.1 DNA-binding transcriptional regulator, FadR family [Maridesulfovibrio ferrireducens]
MSEEKSIKQLFIPVSIGRISEEVVLQIEAAIFDGRLKPGERLPSEREMQTQFGTGRGVIREAVKILKQKGLLEVRKGVKGGAYVKHLEVSNISESLALFLKQNQVSPETLIEFRESMDRTITTLAIARSTAEEKEELLKEALRFEAILREPEPDLEATAELDRKLNIMLACMAGNDLFEWVMRALQMGLSSHDFTLYENASYRDKAATNWRETARAVAEGEPMKALSFIGLHYALLRQCVEEMNGDAASKNAPFLDENTEEERS